MNTLDQRATYFGVNLTAGCGQAAMSDPVMQLALLQVKTVRSAIIIVLNWISRRSRWPRVRTYSEH